MLWSDGLKSYWSIKNQPGITFFIDYCTTQTHSHTHTRQPTTHNWIYFLSDQATLCGEFQFPPGTRSCKWDAATLIVLRPIHEHNMDWFRWGAPTRDRNSNAFKIWQAVFRAVWRFYTFALIDRRKGTDAAHNHPTYGNGVQWGIHIFLVFLFECRRHPSKALKYTFSISFATIFPFLVPHFLPRPAGSSSAGSIPLHQNHLNAFIITLISTIKYTFIIFISRCIPTFILTTTFIRIRSLITNICILLRIPILIPIYIRIRVCLGLLLPQSTFSPHQFVLDPFYSY